MYAFSAKHGIAKLFHFCLCSKCTACCQFSCLTFKSNTIETKKGAAFNVEIEVVKTIENRIFQVLLQGCLIFYIVPLEQKTLPSIL